MLKEFKRKVKKQDFNIDLQPFKADCFVFINMTPAQMNAVMKKAHVNAAQLGEPEIKTINDMKVPSGRYLARNNFRLVALKCDTLFDLIGFFEHEKLHLVHHILDHRGLKLNDETEEAYSYLGQELTEQFLSKLK